MVTRAKWLPLVVLALPFSAAVEDTIETASPSKSSPSGNSTLAKSILAEGEEEAARKGHDKALERVLDRYLFRAGNFLDTANPQLALELYKEAKIANPALRLYDETQKLRVVRICVEMSAALGPFDAEEFRAKYKIKNPNKEPATWKPYFIWSLAEEACRGGRFGKPNRALAFQLILRGGQVPAEFESAMEEAYRKWKSNEHHQFVIDHHITSGIGGAFCSGRQHQKIVDACERKLAAIGTSSSAQVQEKIKKAYRAFTEYIEEKAWNEEGHAGSGWVGWTFDSLMEHKQGYVQLVKRVAKGFRPEIHDSYRDADQRLNKAYKLLVADLEKAPFQPGHTVITHDLIRDVQRLWIPYRDSTAELFSLLNPAVDKMSWKTWLTNKRTKQLETLIEWKKDS